MSGYKNFTGNWKIKTKIKSTLRTIQRAFKRYDTSAGTSQFYATNEKFLSQENSFHPKIGQSIKVKLQTTSAPGALPRPRLPERGRFFIFYLSYATYWLGAENMKSKNAWSLLWFCWFGSKDVLFVKVLLIELLVAAGYMWCHC